LKKTEEMVQSLIGFSKKNSFESVEQSLTGVFDTVANTLIVIQLELINKKFRFFKVVVSFQGIEFSSQLTVSFSGKRHGRFEPKPEQYT